MQLDQLQAELRARSPWEAADLGLAMARRWSATLWGVWLLSTLPPFLALLALTGEQFGFALLIFWWLKPMWERPLLAVVSEALFGDLPTVGQVLRRVPSLWSQDLLAALTLRRFSTTRSLLAPVSQLEGQRGTPAARRRSLLALGQETAAGLLTVGGPLLETAVGASALMLLLLAIPQGMGGVDLIDRLFSADGPYLRYLLPALFYLGISAVAPFYVAMGFAMYIQRRTQLEGWDIEIQLRRLAARSALVRRGGPLLALLLVLGAAPARAAEDAAVDRAVETIYQRPEMGPSETVTRWRPRWELPEGQKAERGPGCSPDSSSSSKGCGSPSSSDGCGSPSSSDGCGSPSSSGCDSPSSGCGLQSCEGPASAAGDAPVGLMVEVLVLALIGAGLVALVAWIWDRRRNPRPSGADPELGQARLEAIVAPVVQPLLPPPPDLPTQVQQLYAEGRETEALGLLYRSALHTVTARHQVRIGRDATEGECVRAVRRSLRGTEAAQLFGDIALAWQSRAYGHRRLSQGQVEALCARWPALMKGEGEPS